MRFDPYAFLAEMRAEGNGGAIRATRAIQERANSTNSTNSTPRAVRAEVPSESPGPAISCLRETRTDDRSPAGTAAAAEVQTHAPSTPLPSGQDADPFPHGISPGGRHLTWTGCIVSLDAWRSLTEWERHGPEGQRWNGRTRRWEQPEEDEA